MARIFVSSTYVDLKDYRQRASLTLRRMGHEDVAMEYFTASEQQPVDKCLSDVATCEIYIGIFAWRYGSIPEDYQQSITELEYHEAQKCGLPCFIFLLAEDTPWRREFIDRDAEDRIGILRQELQENYTVAYFSTPDDLGAKIAETLSHFAQSQLDTGQSLANDEFLKTYLQNVARKHQYIVPPHFWGERRRLPIDALYVVPNVRHFEGMVIDSASELTLHISNTVILADPGGGKSILASKCCFELATAAVKAISLGSQPAYIPILIVVRDYGVAKKQFRFSILDFMHSLANSTYQTKLPSSFFGPALEQGKLVIIFDGLDELLDTTDRQAIVEDIELFHHQYPNSPILVTSRKVGYSEAPLDRVIFDIWLLQGFDQEQTTEYAQKWFSVLPDIGAEEALVAARAFLEELQDVPLELQSNPLLLASLCSIYRGDGYIPSNKPEIYEKCTMLLFEKRDKERGIHYDLPFESDIQPLLMYLAYWIYGNNRRESGVTERDLVTQATDYLLERRFDDRDDAQYAAKRFVEFCVGRAWVFTDTGTTPSGEKIYQFTHRTFLEYFTAGYLLRMHRSPLALIDAALPYVATQQRSEVVQLAFQQMSRRIEGADEEILTLLLKTARMTDVAAQASILKLAANCLEFMTPKPSVVQKIIEDCIEFCLKVTLAFVMEELQESTIQELYLDFKHHNDFDFARMFLGSLANAMSDNRTSIARAVQATLTRKITSGFEYEALLATELALSLDAAVKAFSERDQTNKNKRRQTYLQQITQAILDECGEFIRTSVCSKYIVPALDLFYANRVAIDELLQWHGTEALFQQYHPFIFTHQYFAEVAPSFLTEWNKTTDQDTKQELTNVISVVGDLLLDIPTPWVALKDEGNLWSIVVCKSDEAELLSNRFLFGAFVILAFFQERWHERDSRRSGLHPNQEDTRELFPGYLDLLLLARNDQANVSDTQIEAQLEKCGFTAQQREFAESWMSGLISVTS